MCVNISCSVPVLTVFLVYYRKIEKIDFSKVKGVILNVPSDYKLGFVKIPFDFKHWYVVRKIDSAFYNLDSKLDKPVKLGDRQTAVDFLNDKLKVEKTQLLLVVEPSVENTGSWYTEDTNS